MTVTLQDEYDVVVVGCGPTGATLANLLGLSGIDVLVLEREQDIYPLPRAVHFDDETMRVFQLVGLARDLLDKVRVNPGMRFIDPAGELLLDWPRPEGIGRHGWNTSYRLHQPDLEQLLREQLSKQSITLASGYELTDIKQDSTHVALLCNQVSTQQSKTISTRYVVGCDGAKSTVRRLMRSTYEDLGFRQRWLVVDVLLKQDMPELGDHTIQFCDPVQPMTYCRNPGQRRRWEMALPDSLSDTEALKPEQIGSLLARWITADNAEIERKAIYTFRSAVADSWHNQRLLIAGDAAHLTPPFMGQGMCAGVRDAANLAWKLALCLKQDAKRETKSTFLNSYQQERSPHVREYIDTAIELGWMISAVERKGKPDNATITMKSLRPVFNDTSINQHFDLPVTQHTGHLFGQPKLNDGTLLDDVCGYRPVLISRQYGDEHLAPVNTNSNEDDSIVKLSAAKHPALWTALDELQVNAVLLRPDRYILTTAVSAADVAALTNFSCS